MNKMELYEEPYAPSGNISGKGQRRALGRPSLGKLDLLVREAVQNSWDARRSDVSPHFVLRLKTLAAEQLEALRDSVLAELPPKQAECPLASAIEAGPVRLLEVADSGTKGLGGPTRADTALPSDDTPTDFVDFVRNVGSPRDTHHGGGTYGFGKAVYYGASDADTIIVHSLCRTNGELEERLIACGIGAPYRNGGKRYTGRRWWGRIEEGTAEPFVGTQAAAAAAALGLRDRKGTDGLGTTVAVVQPLLPRNVPEEEGAREVAQRLLHALLWHCWPKMVPRAGSNTPPMTFGLFVEDEELTVPNPRSVPPFDEMCDCLARARGDVDGGSHLERTSGGRVRYGTLALRSTPVRRSAHLPAETESGAGDGIPAHCSHVALMRPAELVVRYEVGPPLPSELVEYVGVFRVSEDDEVERAFARAEPAAHDDWHHETLEKPARDWVRHALRLVRRELREHVSPTAGSDRGGGDERPSTGELSAQLGRELLSGALGTGAGPDVGGGGGGGRGRPRRRVRVESMQCESLVPSEAGAVEYRFRVRLDNGNDASNLTVTPQLGYAMEGGTDYEFEGASRRPEVLQWRVAGAERAGQGGVLELGAAEREAELVVRAAADYALVLELDVAEVADV